MTKPKRRGSDPSRWAVHSSRPRAAVAGLGYTGVIYDLVWEVISELRGNPHADEDYSTLRVVNVVLPHEPD